jgi:hypothetical protein
MKKILLLIFLLSYQLFAFDHYVLLNKEQVNAIRVELDSGRGFCISTDVKDEYKCLYDRITLTKYGTEGPLYIANHKDSNTITLRFELHDKQHKKENISSISLSDDYKYYLGKRGETSLIYFKRKIPGSRSVFETGMEVVSINKELILKFYGLFLGVMALYWGYMLVINLLKRS